MGGASRVVLLVLGVSLWWGTARSENIVPEEMNVKLAYEFEDSTEGWGNSSASSMAAEVYHEPGELRVVCLEAGAHLDSPLFQVPVTDYSHVVIRMAHAGDGTRGKIKFRRGPEVPDRRFTTGLATWEDGDFWEQEFQTEGGGEYAYRTYSISLFDTRNTSPTSMGSITQMRLELAIDGAAGHAFSVQFIRVVNSPCVKQVIGCSAVTHDPAILGEGGLQYPVPPYQQWVRPEERTTSQYFQYAENATVIRGLGSFDSSLPFASTYDCSAAGGDRITIRGNFFGRRGARALVGGRACTHVLHTEPQREITCRVPPGSGTAVKVAVAEGSMPILRGEVPFLSYAVGPEPPPLLVVSNIGSLHMDVNWRAPVDAWDALATDGYSVEWRVERPLSEVIFNGSFPDDYVYDRNSSGGYIYSDPRHTNTVSQAYLEMRDRKSVV